MLSLTFVQFFVYSFIYSLDSFVQSCVMALKKKKIPPLYHSIIFLIYGDIKRFHGFINITLEITWQMFPYLILINEKNYPEIPRKACQISLDPEVNPFVCLYSSFSNLCQGSQDKGISST